MPEEKIIFKRFKELREDRGLIQSQLAEHLGIGRASVSNYENGDRFPDAKALIKYADFFGVTIDYLLERSEFKKFEQEYNYFRNRLGAGPQAGPYSAFVNPTKKTIDLNDLNYLMVSIDENYSSIITEIITGNEEFRMASLISLEKLLKVLVFTVDFFKDEEDIRAYDDNTLRYIEFLKRFIGFPDLSNLDFDYIKSSNEEKIRGCATCFNEFITLFVCSIIDFKKSRRAETPRNGLKNAVIDKILEKLI
ncbi:MAG TPA: helix-turn-helix domain-containing protein [Desulfosporosinus sp.]|nr:helix-turn-helix domain-containing protein [Desulfosporosinus sp.]